MAERMGLPPKHEIRLETKAFVQLPTRRVYQYCVPATIAPTSARQDQVLRESSEVSQAAWSDNAKAAGPCKEVSGQLL